MYKFVDASFSYRYDRSNALEGINLLINESDQIALTSDHNDGKTTVLRSLMLGLEISHGELLFNNRNIYLMKKKELRIYLKKIYFISKLNTLFEYESVYENLKRSLNHEKTFFEFFGFITQNENDIIYQVLNEIGIAKYAFTLVWKLDSSIKLLVELAKLFLVKPKIILADDPTSNIDWRFSNYFIKLLKKYCKENKITLIFTSHDLPILNKYFESIYLIKNHKLNLMKKEEIDIRLKKPLLK